MATEGDDLIEGFFGNDVLSGLGGDDTMFGRAGDDTLSGNSGSDFLKGGEGDDLMFGGTGADILISGERDTSLISPFTANLRIDRPDGGDDSLFGGSGNDQLVVTSDSNEVSVNGGSGVDTLGIGLGDFAGGSFLLNFLAVDVLNATATIDLAAGTGRYLFANPRNGTGGAVVAGSIINLDLSIAEVENVRGSSFSEFISGDAGANVLNGAGGDDTLQGRGGSDTLNGGTGFDRAIYDNSPLPITIDLRDDSGQRGGDAQGDILISIEGVDGSRGDDSIIGNDEENVLFGNLGDDELQGGGGADTIDGGGGRDGANYGFSAAIDIDLTRFFQLGGDAQGDRLISIEDIGGSIGDDIIRGSSADNSLFGSNGDDILEGRGGNDRLFGGFDDDFLDGGLGNDTLDGQDGFDTVTLANSAASVVTLGQNGGDGRVVNFQETDTLRSIENVIGSIFTDSITGNEQVNILSGGSGDDTLDGRENSDILNGGAGNDTLLGGSEADTLDGGTGNDILDGQDGFDTVTLANSAASVVTLGQNGGDGRVVNFQETDTLRSVENVIGSIFTDNITGNEQVNILSGGSGDDTLDGRENSDILNGGAGNDTLLGGSEADTLDGGTGNDTLDGQGGSDTVTLINSAASTVTLGQNGGDGRVVNFQETDTLRSIENVIGSIFTDNIVGNEQVNRLDGGSGSDTLDGRNGDDTLIGGVGNDTYLFSGANFGGDIVSDTSGTDTARFDFRTIESIARVGNNLFADLTGGTFTVVNHFTGFQVENAQDAFTNQVVTLAVGLTGGDAPGIIAGTDDGETLDGRGGNDLLYGNDGRDTLLGGDGNDLLNGGKGKDVLVGGQGADTLIGGKGNDTFVFAPGGGDDIIRDFGDGNDRIDLTAFDTTFKALDDNRDGELDRGEGDGQLSVTHDHGDTLLNFAGGSIRIVGVTHLGANDFLL